jgi:hypothetical protein
MTDPKPEPADEGQMSTVRIVVTVVLLFAFGALVAVLMVAADSGNEVVWGRRVYLLGGVEAIVFASVGWLFGREVHRSEATTAKKDAADAKKDAAAANDEAKAKTEEAAIERTKGQAVKAAVRNLTPGAPDAGGGAKPVGLDDAAAPVQVAGLAGMCEELWPD